MGKNQGDIVNNVRFDTEFHSLSKRDPTVVACTADADGPITGLHRFYKKDGTKVTIVNYSNKIVTCNDSTGLPTTILTVSTADNRWQWATWHDLAIGTDGTNQPVKYDGTSASATYLGSLLALDAESGSGPDGTYTYKVTCTTASYDLSLDTTSNSVTVSDNDIDLSMIPICPTTYLGETVTGRKIYRTEDGGSTYKLLSNGTISDNTTTTLTDSDADGALGATLSPDDTDKPPTGKLIVIHKNRMWIANNSNNPSRLYYSEDGMHDYFIADSYFDIRPNDGDEITFIKNLLGLLTVSKNNTIQKVITSGDDPDADWAITDPFSFVGCQSPYSAVNSDAGIIYLGNNGIYIFTGQYSDLISNDITPEIRDILPSNYPNVWGAFYKNSYYLTYTSNKTGSSVNNRILIADMIDKSYSIDIFSANVLTVFSSGSDVEALYSGASDSGKIYAHTETTKEIIHKRHSDFTGTFDDMRYIPEYVGGDPEDPVFELAWTCTVDSVTDPDWTGTVDSVTTSIVDRPDKDGSYTSPYLTVNASSLDKIYWNETIPSGGGDVTFDIRTGSSTTDTAAASWTTGYTDSAGSDISGVTGNTIMQYRVNMTTDTIIQTPTLYLDSNYVIRVTYNLAGNTDETSIPLQYRTGWLDFGYPGYVKELRKIYVYYEWPEDTSGTLTLTFTSIKGETDTFSIDLLEHPSYYIDYFPEGNLIGEFIRMEIEETSINPLKIKKIMIVYDVEAPLT